MSLQRNIISFHVGQCGVQISLPQWELFAKEHNIGIDGYMPKILEDADFEDESFETLFYETPSGKRIPRTILIDTDFSVLDHVKQSRHCKLFSDDYLVSYKDDCSSNFALGYGRIGEKLHIKVVDKIRKLSEQSDDTAGFMITHSLGGGTGSGYGSLLLEKIRPDVFGDAKLTSIGFQILPSPTLSPQIVEPYNAVLGIYKQIDLLDIVSTFDNEALYDISNRLIPEGVRPTYDIVNQLISRIIAGFTASLRHCTAGSLRSMVELEKILVPRSDLHFLMCSTTPVTHKYNQDQLRICDMTFEAFDSFNNSVRCDPNLGKFISGGLMYRGDIMPSQVEKAVKKVKEIRNLQFVPWANYQDGFNITINHNSLVHGDNWLFHNSCRSLTAVHNNTEIINIFDSIANQYFQLYKKELFKHWFTSCGLEEDEFEATNDCFKDMHELYYEIKNRNDAPLGEA